MTGIQKTLLIGCAGSLVLGLATCVGVVVWLSSAPESGVKLTNEMDQYALDYLAQHDLLEPGEEVLAYYDVTMSMDGTEAAILTGERVLYHRDGQTTAIRLRDVEDVRHRYESLVGDVIEVEGSSGQVLKIQIAPLNSGETFKNVLFNAWRRAREKEEDG